MAPCSRSPVATARRSTGRKASETATTPSRSASGRIRGEVLALTYLATRKNSALRPYTWYLRHVLAGARQSGLPARYIEAIERVQAVRDTDAEREARELAIHG